MNWKHSLPVARFGSTEPGRSLVVSIMGPFPGHKAAFGRGKLIERGTNGIKLDCSGSFWPGKDSLIN